MVSPSTSSTAAAASSNRPPLHLRPTETNRLNRTQIIRRTEYGFTAKQIIATMTAQMGIPEHRLFESVLRDPRDNRRFYLTYRTMDMKLTVTGRGFHLGGIFIRPEDNTTEGYIPYPPYYMDKRTLDDLLTEYGQLTHSDFTTTDNGTRIAGYTFAIKLKTNKTLPETITYNNCDMYIRLKDDIRYCTYCKRHGHTTGRCRARKHDDVLYTQKRTDTRTAQTTQYNQEVDAINTTEFEALQLLNSEFEQEMQNMATAHNERLVECQTDGVSAAKIELLHHDYKLRQDAETIERDEVEVNLQGRYEEKRLALASEYRKMGFRPERPPQPPQQHPSQQQQQHQQQHQQQREEAETTRLHEEKLQQQQHQQQQRLRDEDDALAKRKRDDDDEIARKKSEIEDTALNVELDAAANSMDTSEADDQKDTAPKAGGGGLFSYFTSSKSPPAPTNAPAMDADVEASHVTYMVTLRYDTTLRRMKSSSFAYGHSCDTNLLGDLQFIKEKPPWGLDQSYNWYVRGVYSAKLQIDHWLRSCSDESSLPSVSSYREYTARPITEGWT